MLLGSPVGAGIDVILIGSEQRLAVFVLVFGLRCRARVLRGGGSGLPVGLLLRGDGCGLRPAALISSFNLLSMVVSSLRS